MADILTLVLLIVLSAFFSSAETALISLSLHKVNAMVKQKKYGAKSLYQLKQHPRRLVITILIGNNVVNVWATAVATLIAEQYFGSLGLGIVVGTMTFVLLMFGEITPKSIAINYAESYSRIIAKPIQILQWIIYPVVITFEGFTNLIAKARSRQPMTEEELISFIEASARDKVIESKEKELIEGVLEFNDISVKQVMTPRSKMFSLDGELRLSKALKTIQSHHYSRVPITEGSPDKIIGVVLIRDVLGAVEANKDPLLREIARKPYFVTSERIISDLFRDMQKQHIHLAIVVDEYGGTAGMVTLEDLMEEIVGEIQDESDVVTEHIQHVDKNIIIARGDTAIVDINDCLKIELPEGKHVTLNGYLQHLVKGMPRKGRKVEKNKIFFTILETDQRQILKVRVEKK
ncbi:MAG: hemolysin family protein [Nanoarchaeota archaeon]